METLLVGWHEIADLPDLGISKLPVKIDTGAKTSSIHATDIEVFKIGNIRWIRFQTEKANGEQINIETPIFDQRQVKSSNGQTETRYVIETLLSLGGHHWGIQLTLADRSNMRFKMLLGRRAMNNIQVVPCKANLLAQKT